MTDDRRDVDDGAWSSGVNQAHRTRARPARHADGYCTGDPNGARWTISTRVPQGSVM